MVSNLIPSAKLESIIEKSGLVRDIVCGALDIITSDYDTDEEAANYLADLTAAQIADMIVDSYRDAMGDNKEGEHLCQNTAFFINAADVGK